MRKLLPAALLVALLAGVRLLWAPGLLGYAGSEVWGHAWVQWWHAQALPAWPKGTDLAIGTSTWPVIDPLPTALAAALGRLAGPIFGYNAWILASFGLAFAGGAVLARRWEGDAWAGGLCLAMAPALTGSLTSGLTEDGAVGLAALGLACLPPRSYREGLVGGLALGLLAWCGLVLAWFAALAAAGLGLHGVVKDRKTLGPLALAGVLALALAVPLALGQGDRMQPNAAHAVMAFEPLWRLNPWRGVDLASLFVPGRPDTGGALIRMHPGYLGLVALVLAALGGRSRWWFVLLGAMAVGLGPRLSFAGHPFADNPLPGLLPLSQLVNHHGRALLVGAIALSVLAARGARGRPRWVLALLALDFALLSPVPWPLLTADATPPEIDLSSLPPGRLLVLPAAGPGIHFQRPLFDQRVHGRPLLLDPNRPGAGLGRSESARWLMGLAQTPPPPPPATFRAPSGLSVILVTEPYVSAVRSVLGPPDVSGPGAAAWSVAVDSPR